MTALIGAVFLASLLGSLHCAGMCGPLAAFAALVDSPGAGGCEAGGSCRGSLPWRLLVAYNGGRLLTYALLGALAGLLGAALDLGGSLVGVQRVASITAGVFMIAIGLVAALRILGLRFPGMPRAGSRLGFWIRRAHGAAISWRPLPRSLAVGLLTALLPCGWLYAFVVAAAGTGHPLWGAATLAAFWAGTVPVLASIGFGIQRLTGITGRKVQLAASLLVVILGILSVVVRWDLPLAGRALAKPPATVEEAVQRVESLGAEEPPCCQHER